MIIDMEPNPFLLGFLAFTSFLVIIYVLFFDKKRKELMN